MSRYIDGHENTTQTLKLSFNEKHFRFISCDSTWVVCGQRIRRPCLMDNLDRVESLPDNKDEMTEEEIAALNKIG